MPRPGQQSHRRKRKHDEDRQQAVAAIASAPSLLQASSSATAAEPTEADEEDAGPRTVAGQALPIAILPEDFEGDANDGATYLALANREAAKLPFNKRVQPPSHLVRAPKAAEPETAETRHPALPRDSWQTLYAAHFKAYRKHVQNAPRSIQDVSLPKPRDAAGWLGYIQGVLLKSRKGKERADQEVEGEEAVEDIEMDEEAALNDADGGLEDGEGLPELVSREPLLSVLRSFDSPSLLMILRHLTFYITGTLESLQEYQDEPSNPLPASHARWAFAILALIDDHLTSDEISILRDFARAAAAAAEWRWMTAVADEEATPVPITEGFYGDGELVPGDRWALGARWKSERDSRPRSEPSARPNPDGGVDEDLANAWMCAHAVIAGWAQWDLLDDFERNFSKLPRP